MLSSMGKAVIHAGAAGAGQAAKICNNMILGIPMIAVCEGFVPGARSWGSSAEKLFDISSQIVGPMLVDDQLLPGAGAGAGVARQPRLPPGFTAAKMLKDLRLAQQAARSAAPRRRSGRSRTALRPFCGERATGAGFLRDHRDDRRRIC